MASGALAKKDERAEAMRLLERGRAEISAEMRWLRDRVNPKEALRRGVEHHPVIVMGAGVAVGLAAGLALWRHHQHRDESAHSHHTRRARSDGAAAKRSGLGSMLIGQAMHMLVPLVLMPALENFVKRRSQHVTSASYRP